LPSLLAASFLPWLALDLSAQELLQPGAKAPDFTSRDRSGAEVKLSDFRGKVVVLDFWASWCGPCVASMPHVQQVAKQHAGDVVVLAVCTSDTRKKFEQWIDGKSADYGNIKFACELHERGSDTFEERASSKLYHVSGLPTKFVVGRDGVIAASLVGWDDGDLQLEAGLARAGIAIDAAIAKKGEEQLKEAADAQKREAAEAKRRPVPAFYPALMGLAYGDAVPDLDLIGPDGKPTKLSARRGKVQIVALSPVDSIPRKDFQDVAVRYQAYGVQTMVLAALTSRADYDAFAQQSQPKYAFTVFGDPVGTLDDSANATQEERMAFHAKTLIGKLFGAGSMYPAMPAFFVMDAEGKVVGSFFRNAKMLDGIGNLLLKAGIQLEAKDMPAEVAAANAFDKPKPREREAEVALIQVGAKAPDFAMKDLDGKQVHLADYAGKVVILDFWATWCGPCKAALPHVQSVAAKYKDQDVVVLASCTSDSRDAFESWVRVNGPKYADILFAHDPLEKSQERPSRKLYGVSGIPQQFVIDRTGVIVGSVSGYMEGEVLLDGALAKAGVKVDAETLKKAAEDQAKRDAREKKTVPAQPMVPMKAMAPAKAGAVVPATPMAPAKGK
jgi:thiol-disulfide isomerase/thioredoxin